MMESWQHSLAAGQAALQNADWDGARAHFEAALRDHDSAAAHDGLGLALWWQNEITAAHAQRTLAYNGFRQHGNPARAALIASWLAREQIFLYGNAGAMHGWFARAERLLAEIAPGVESAWCMLLKASMVEPPDRLARIAEESLAAARRYGDPNLEAFALAFGGLANVVRGRVKNGMLQLDEALTMATGGELVDYTTISEIFCVLLSACEAAGDLVRSEHWCRVAAEYAERHRFPYLSAFCLATYGSLLTAVGRWQEAEAALTKAVRAFEVGHRGLRVPALLKLAELRVSQGKLGEAATLVAGFEDQSAAVLPRARLYLAQGNAPLARAILSQALAASAEPTLYDIPLLALLATAALEIDDVESAWQAAEQMERLATQSQSPFLLAQTALTKGRIQLNRGAPQALDAFALALQQLARFEQSLLAGEARLEMAHALSASDRPGAIAWAQAALATFERIGASGRRAEAAGLLRALGSTPATRPRLATPLTQRESEILTLLAEGLSNPEIGQRLYISPKTVEHHVSRILGKLNVRNRAAAAAWALAEGSAGLASNTRADE